MPTGVSGESKAALTLNPFPLPVGTYTIKFVYSGDGWFLGSSGVLSYSFAVTATSLTAPVIRETPPSGGGAGSSGSPAEEGGVQDDGSTRVVIFDGVDGGVDSSADGGGHGGVIWTNSSGSEDGQVQTGDGTDSTGLPRVIQESGGTQIVIVDGTGVIWAETTGGGIYTQPLGDDTTVMENTSTGELEENSNTDSSSSCSCSTSNPAGTQTFFYDFGAGTPAGRAGRFKRRVDAAGNVKQVTSWDAAGRPTEVQMTSAATGAVESLVYAYSAAGELNTLTRRREIGGGAWSTVRTAAFTYANVTGVTKKALVGTSLADAGGNVLEETYNRYYASGSTSGYAGGLQYHLGAQSTARLKAAYVGTALSTLTDAQVAAYADKALKYDPSNKRVTQVITAGAGCSACSGGFGTSSIITAVNASAGTGVNDWKAKVAETLDDGTIHVSYANKWGQTLLRLTTEAGTGKTWITYSRYNAVGRLILQASPGAVTGYSESLTDLIGYGSGTNATYLNDATGLISTYAYGTGTTATAAIPGDVSTFLKSTSIRNGELGTAVKQSDVSYFLRSTGTINSYRVAAQTRYRNADGTGAEINTTAYTWQGATQQAASVTSTTPVVSAAQNGSGTASSTTVVFDTLGRVIWSKDAAGVLNYTAYDPQTGAAVKTISDVNTAITSDFANLPSGWTTPSGAGNRLISTYETDSLGRTTKSVDPLGLISYTVYNDITKEIRSYAGWNTTTNTSTGPTMVRRDDWANGYSESITMSASPTVVGGRPTGTEAISGIQTLSRSYRNPAGQTTYSDAYFDLAGVTYTTAVNIGTLNTNFYRTQTVYDKQGRQTKTISAAGTIMRTEFDAMGRTISTWVGTNDVPTTGFWSVTNTAGTDMVKVAEVEYDNGGIGDGNATKMTQYPGGSAPPRVSQTWYDWRDRTVASKSGVQASEDTTTNRAISYTQYDNLGEAVSSEVYTGDTVTVVDANADGVPDRPAASLLRAKTVSTYDDLGRAYLTQTYSVDPTSGAVSASALTSQVWFDLRGLTLKSASPGGLVQKTGYDSLGRATTSFVTDGGGDTTWADAGNVTGDTVLSQSEMTYNADSNVILSVDRQRFHDATGTGALGTPTSGVNARVIYSAAYYDIGNRTTASVNVGTNGGSVWTRPTTAPSRSDTVLVSETQYDSAGRAWKSIDPKGIESRTTSDLMGRTTKTIQNYVDGVVSNADDKTTEYTYSAAGMTKLIADLTGGGVQTTEYVYGVTIANGNSINSNDIVGATKWPDPTTGLSSTSEQETATVNALGQTLTSTDRNGNTHSLGYDVLGRVVTDTVMSLDSGVDGSVRRIETATIRRGTPTSAPNTAPPPAAQL